MKKGVDKLRKKVKMSVDILKIKSEKGRQIVPSISFLLLKILSRKFSEILEKYLTSG